MPVVVGLGIRAAGRVVPPIYLLYAGAWVVGLVVALLDGQGLAVILMVHVAPVILALAVSWTAVVVRIVVGTPPLLPLLFLIVLLPTFTEDVWRVAGSVTSAQLAGLAAITSVPLLAALIVTLWRRPVEEVFTAACARLVVPSATGRSTRRLLAACRLGELPASDLAEELHAVYDNPQVVRVAQDAAALLGRRFLVRAVGRVITAVAGVGASACVLVYLVAVIAVPRDVVVEWAGRPIDRVTPDVAAWRITMLVQPVTTFAVLLGLVVMAIFLASCLTEDRFAGAVQRRIVDEYAEDVLLVALPWVAYERPTRELERRGWRANVRRGPRK